MAGVGRGGKYPAELRERAVRMVLEHQGEYPSQWKAIESIAVEVERISEGQRFVTKLLSERPPASLPGPRGGEV